MNAPERNLITLVAGVLLAYESITAAHGSSLQQEPLVRHLRAGGDWATDGRRQRAAQTWDFDVKRVGDSLAGTIELSGSALATSGVVQGRIKGERVFGSIQDEAGRLIARFEGERQDGVVRGRYHDRSGETGSWSWAGGWE